MLLKKIALLGCYCSVFLVFHVAFAGKFTCSSDFNDMSNQINEYDSLQVGSCLVVGFNVDEATTLPNNECSAACQWQTIGSGNGASGMCTWTPDEWSTTLVCSTLTLPAR